MATLTEVVREVLRLSSQDDTPLEVDALVAGFKSDMERVGVPYYMYDENSPDPLVQVACMLYCKANYGYDNAEASRFLSSYRQIVKDIRNSPSTYRPGYRTCDADALE